MVSYRGRNGTFLCFLLLVLNVLQNMFLLELLALNFIMRLAIKLTHSGLCWICLKRVNLDGLFCFGLG